MADSIDLTLSPEDLLALVDMGRELGAELNMRKLLSRILTRACQLTDSPAGSVLLHDPVREDLYFAEAAGPDAGMLLERWGPNREKGVPVEGSKAGQVLQTGESLRVAALSGDTAHFKGVDKGTGHATQSMVCVRLGKDAERLGVMQLLNKHNGDYTPRDVVLLEHFASQAAVALRNAALMEDVLAQMGWYSSQPESNDPFEFRDKLRKKAGQEELSVMFADMRGYNRLCQSLDRPEQMQEILDEFLSELAATVLAHDGIVNKFLGDGLLAIFRGFDGPVRAVRCALELTRKMPGMRTKWDARSNASLGFLDIGMGIATDTVILGSIGTARVRDFTVLGTGVNLAAHLTRDARQGRRILVDKRTYRAVQDLVTADGPEDFELKKPDQPQGRRYERYSITGLLSDIASRVDSTGTTAGAAGPAARSAPTRDGVFISYSHRDKEWLALLQTHLRPYVRGGTISVWDDTQIKPGADWQREIADALARAKVAVLLVSPHFLESEFVAREEWPALLGAARDNGLTVIWFVLSACSYTETDIPTYQAALDPECSLDSLTTAERNRALVTVCQRIKEAMR